MKKPILSLFSGIGGLDRGFTKQGYCVVAAPEKILGGNILDFTAPSGSFEGVIGGPPCQPYSRLNRHSRQSAPHETLDAFCRIVTEAQPDWFLCENVIGVPDIDVQGYDVQRFNFDLLWISENSRLRRFQFGSKHGVILNPMAAPKTARKARYTALDTHSKLSPRVMADIQGFGPDLDLSQFTVTQQKRLIGNSVPVPMAFYIAGLIKQATTGGVTELETKRLQKLCGCGCKRQTYGGKMYASGACKVAAHRARKKAQALSNPAASISL